MQELSRLLDLLLGRRLPANPPSGMADTFDTRMPTQFGPYQGSWGGQWGMDGGFPRREFTTLDGNAYFLDPRGDFLQWEDSPTFAQEVAEMGGGFNPSHFEPSLLEVLGRLGFNPRLLQTHLANNPNINTWKQRSR